MVYGMGSLSLDLLPRPTQLKEKLPDNLHLRRKMSCSSPLPRGPGIARHLCKLSVLTNPASNLTSQPFPGVYQVKLAPSQAQGRRQPPARGGGRQRSKTSNFCQLLAVKSIALCTMALPDPGWGEAGRDMPGVAVGPRLSPGLSSAPASSGDGKNENLKILSQQENLGETRRKLSKKKFPEQVWLFSVKMPSLVLLSKTVCWRTEWILKRKTWLMQVFKVLKILSVQLKKLFVFSFLRIQKTEEIPPKKTCFFFFLMH